LPRLTGRSLIELCLVIPPARAFLRGEDYTGEEGVGPVGTVRWGARGCQFVARVCGNLVRGGRRRVYIWSEGASGAPKRGTRLLAGRRGVPGGKGQRDVWDASASRFPSANEHARF